MNVFLAVRNLKISLTRSTARFANFKATAVQYYQQPTGLEHPTRTKPTTSVE
jgi:hypothetical protein